VWYLFATGTLLPPIFKGQLEALTATPDAKVALFGVVVSVIGIVLIGGAGISKEKELPEEAKKKAVAEYNFKKGIIAALFSGLMSAGMNFGLQSGSEIQSLAIAGGTSTVWQECRYWSL
jgi:L-rhamnose-H+ transport protein